MKEFTHIDIHSKAFPLNEEFSANCDEADRQMKIAGAAPDLLVALERILYAHDNHGNGAAMGEALLCEQYAHMARAAVAKAKGEPS